MKKYLVAVECLYEIQAKTERKALSMAKEMARDSCSGMWTSEGSGELKKVLSAMAISPHPTVESPTNE
jgi:hypothetical protein